MISFHAQYSPAHNRFLLYITENSGKERFVCRPLVFDKRNLGEVFEPAVSLDDIDARQLMDSLWAAGVRPTNVGSSGQLAATEKHLEDMRTLVFK